MSHSSSDITAFLTPPGAVLHQPDEAEQALAVLWQKPTPKEPASEAESTLATRICMANLLVIAHSQQWHELSSVLGELSPRFPTRTLVVLLADNHEDADQADREVWTTVSAICHLPQAGQSQVCCEQLVLRTAARGASDMAHTVLPLLEADVPTLLWWRLPPGQCESLRADLQALTDRTIVENGPRALVAVPVHNGRGYELGWFRTAAWRNRIASLLDGVSGEVFASIHHVRIVMGTKNPTDRLDAIWLAAFLAGQLGWQPIERAADGIFRFATSAGNSVELQFVANQGSPEGLEHLSITAGTWRFVIHRCGRAESRQYQMFRHHELACQLPRCIELKKCSISDALATACTRRLRDPVFERALPIARWLDATACLERP